MKSLSEPSNYLELLKFTLTQYQASETFEYFPLNSYNLSLRAKSLGLFDRLLEKFQYRIFKRVVVKPEKRWKGFDIPSIADTMIGLVRLNHLESCVREILKKEIAGDFIEAGVWRGGATIFMRAILKEFLVTDRTVWVADSFCGLPTPDKLKYPEDNKMQLHKMKLLSVSLSEVKQRFSKYQLLDSQVKFVEGWFRDSLPSAQIGKLALLRQDCDMYESTMDSLVHLYPKLNVGGIIIVDDYGSFDSCKKAVDAYRERNNIREEILNLDGETIHWVKEL